MAALVMGCAVAATPAAAITAERWSARSVRCASEAVGINPARFQYGSPADTWPAGPMIVPNIDAGPNWTICCLPTLLPLTAGIWRCICTFAQGD